MDSGKLFKEASLHSIPNSAEDALKLAVAFP